MRVLLGLLLVMGIVGCGGEATSPKSSQAKIDEPLSKLLMPVRLRRWISSGPRSIETKTMRL